MLPFPVPQGPWLLCPCQGHVVQLPTDTGAGQEGLGNHSSFPELALTEQTLAVLALAGIAAYFWKLLRLPGMEPPFFSLHSQTGSF